ncbi:helix-turn-helix transcriptional regulator [Cellulosilyticum sp. WCF-2]|uniref:helix-turn-helix transcriptional regulator n=1 Tax=Cellulosilyticum sp. WCF-2 TaxID=2497860 RepID=UPI000F8C344A|nr:helix-turn-helix transcriptional regulator [Cellulosilyticum sp. WCF-2]QEH68685.1 helix-turn-helix transcriptional regulator [Cellulosilyticum sp. WCF-2]
MNVMIARKRKRLTQDQVCEAAGIGRSTLSKIENGKDANVSKEVMLKLASVLDSTVDYLFFSEEN